MPAKTARVVWKAEIDGENRVPLFRRKALEGGHVLNAGIIDEDVHLAEGVGTARHHPLDGVRLAHVGAVEQSVDAVLFGKPGSNALDFRAVAKTVEHDIRAAGRQRPGDPEPDPAGRARDDGRPAHEGALRSGSDRVLSLAHQHDRRSFD
jgi:hypothetical protein